MKTRLKQLRLENGYTQTQVAQNLKISQASYSALETGNRELTAKYLIALSHLYHTSTDYILCFTDEKERKR